VILLDTDVCVSLLRGNADIAKRIRASSPGASVSFMTAAELAYGAEKSARPDRNRALVERFLLTVPVIESERSSMRLFGKIKAELEASGERLPDADLLIAAVALDRDLMLATGNLRHFARIPGLKAQDWLA
jgi:tRNA(fMet)-specific endonuclease VapC